MQLPPQYVGFIDHRMTVLMAFTLRRDAKWFGPDHGESKQLGDVYRASLEGAGIMLRALIEFVGVKSAWNGKLRLVDNDKKGDTILGHSDLTHILQVRSADLEIGMAAFIAKMHDEAAKRTAHPTQRISTGLDPDDLAKATEWVVREIWDRCYKPDPIIIHRDIFSLLKDGTWKGIPFRPAG
jgi:hypothetical protein